MVELTRDLKHIFFGTLTNLEEENHLLLNKVIQRVQNLFQGHLHTILELYHQCPTTLLVIEFHVCQHTCLEILQKLGIR